MILNIRGAPDVRFAKIHFRTVKNIGNIDVFSSIGQIINWIYNLANIIFYIDLSVIIEMANTKRSPHGFE